MEQHAFSDSQEGLSWKDIAWLMSLACNFLRQPWCLSDPATCRLSDIVGTSVLTLNGVAVRALVLVGTTSRCLIIQFHPDPLISLTARPSRFLVYVDTEAKLGWVLTIAFIGGLFPVALYSSLLMSRQGSNMCANKVVVPKMSRASVRKYMNCQVDAVVRSGRL